MRPLVASALLASLLAFVLSCGGGGGGGGGNTPPPPPDVTIKDILFVPSSPGTNSLVELTASFSSRTPSANLTKNWSVSSGTLLETYPDFTLTPRHTPSAVKKPSLSTTASSVYWRTPPGAGSYTVTLVIGSAKLTRVISVVDEPVSMSVVTQPDGRKVISVTANGVTDLYQVAFRLNYNGTGYVIDSVTIGDFLGTPPNILSLVVRSLPNTIPIALTKKGNVPGATGSGVLATVIFKPRTGTSSLKSASISPALSVLVRSARDSKNRELTKPR